MRYDKSITLKDMEGNDHEWVVTLLEAGPGVDLGFEIWEIAGAALGNLLGAGQKMGDDVVLDGSAIGRALSGVATQLIRRGGSKFIAKLLKGTTRDGKRLLFEGDKPPKDKDEAALARTFRHLFRGNYGESWGSSSRC